MTGAYKRSKFLAEQEALRFAREGGSVVIVNPTAPVGSRDVKPTPTGRTILDFLNGRMPAYVDTGLNLVDARECAQGHWQAYLHGRPGERYILGSENLTLREILETLSDIDGRPAPRVRLPWAVALAAGACFHRRRPPDGQVPARPPGRRSDGPQEDVGHPRQGRTRTRLPPLACQDGPGSCR
jgi:dihydroflavonol-4-reductase